MSTHTNKDQDIEDVLPKPGAKGITRLLYACKYSKQGFIAAWKHEEAFRQECILAIILTPCALVLAENAIQLAALLASILAVLITELLNSAIESVVDRIGLEIHSLAGQAKDMGSAAVLLSLILATIVWISVVAERFYG